MNKVCTYFLSNHKINYLGFRNYAKEIKFGNDGKCLLLKGAETVANLVSVTLGPKAGNVIVDCKSPEISRDCNFIANSVTLSDQYENIGADIMKKLAETTKNHCGKLATVLAKEIAKEGYNRIVKGSNPIEIRQGILDAVKFSCKYLDDISKDINTKEDIEKLTMVFAKGDERLGKVIGEAIQLVGKDGAITVKESEIPEESATLNRGFILDSGYYMCNFPVDRGHQIKLDEALLVIFEGKVEDFKCILPVLELAKSKYKPVVLLAEDFSTNVAITFALNNEAMIGIKCVCVKIPNDKDFDKEILKDLAFSFGGKLYGDEACGMRHNKINETYFGLVPEIMLSKTQLLCIHGNNDLHKKKMADINNELDNTTDEATKSHLKMRLNRLESNIAIISIDGRDKTESKKIKEKIYTILANTRIAMAEGIVPGAGLALVRCAAQVAKMTTTSDDYKLGVKILTNSLSKPFNTLIENGHENSAHILCKLKNQPINIGYDVVNRNFVDVYDAGIVDATKAVKSALINAANTASLMVNTEAVVVYKFDGTEIVL